VGKITDRLQRIAAKSRWAVWLASKLRNQCNRVIAYAVCESPRSEINGEAWLLESLAGKVGVIFDVGANKGEWTELALRILKTVRKAVLFEPGIGVCAQLKERFANNPAVEVLQVAAGNSPGSLEFHESAQSSEGSSLWALANQLPSRTYAVSLTTIEAECSRLGLSELDLLKVDTEGNDFHVLEGAASLLRKQLIGVVQFEYGPGWIVAGSTLRRATDYLAWFGYAVFALKPDRLERVSALSLGEYFGYSNFVALSPKFRPLFESNSR
jgi:FkbM family methyltransferase